jgi:hypothetical protein
MENEKDLLTSLLNKIGYTSKAYVNTPKKSRDSGEYLRQIWITKSCNKNKAKEELIRLGDLLEEEKILYEYLCEKNVAINLQVEDGDFKDSFAFLLPVGIELIKQLDSTEDQSCDIEIIIEKSFTEYYKQSLEEMINRLQEPLTETDTMSAKSAIFCWYLILNGAISKNNAFILQIKKDDKEYELHTAIVQYLDDLSKYIFPSSYKSNKSGKPFKRGDLSNFVRRNKDIRNSFGEYFAIENDLFYFNSIDSNAEIDQQALKWIVNTICKRMQHYAVEEDNISETISKSVIWYRLNSPIKQSHQRTLFIEKPSDNYYPILESLVYEEFMEEDGDGTD